MTAAEPFPVAVGQAGLLRERQLVAPFTVPISVTRKRASATLKRQRREAVTVAEDLKVFVSDGDLLALVKAGAVKVHKHGSGAYRGQYLCLRPAGGRRDKRPVLASGRPEKLRTYLVTLGIRLCLAHRSLSFDACPGCRGAA